MTINTTETTSKNIFCALTLDGGGAMGFYTLGVLKELEAMIGCPLHEKFNLVFGTSTGSIIASLIALGHSVDSIHSLYEQHIPTVMGKRCAASRTKALINLSQKVFGDDKFDQVKIDIDIVATRWSSGLPMIFKSNIAQTHGRTATFVSGFGVSIADAVRASCSAVPFFKRATVKTSIGEEIELIDGGYCANNPALYAIADAIHMLENERANIRLLSIGVRSYPDPKPNLIMRLAKKYLVSVQFLQKTLEINTQSMDQLRRLLFKDILMIRISETYNQPEIATDMFEHDLKRLDILFQCGRKSFGSREKELCKFLQ